MANAEGNVVGLMPHPEHAVDPLLGSGDGALVLASLVDSARDRLLRARVSGIPHARVEQLVRDVDKEVREHDRHREQDRQAEHDRVVTGEHGGDVEARHSGTEKMVSITNVPVMR